MTVKLGGAGCPKNSPLRVRSMSSPSRCQEKPGPAQQDPEDRVDAAEVAPGQSAQRQGRDRIVVEISAENGDVGVVAGQRGIGEHRIQTAEVAVIVQALGLVVDQPDGVRVEVFLGQSAHLLGGEGARRHRVGGRTVGLNGGTDLSQAAPVVFDQPCPGRGGRQNHQIGPEQVDECGTVVGLQLPGPLVQIAIAAQQPRVGGHHLHRGPGPAGGPTEAGNGTR